MGIAYDHTRSFDPAPAANLAMKTIITHTLLTFILYSML